MLSEDGQIKKTNCRTRGRTKVVRGINVDGSEEIQLNSFVLDRNKN